VRVFEGRGRVFQLVAVPGADAEGTALGRQGIGTAVADAFAAAGDESDFVVEGEVHNLELEFV
jgi:hypothetical protein